MKINKKFLIIAGWILFIFILKSNGLITLDIENVKQYLYINKTYAAVIFIGIWIARLFVFVPGVMLMVLGGMIFGTINGFALSMLGIALSESAVFVFANLFTSSKIKEFANNKYPDIVPLIEAYNYRFLALGIICPVAPTDIICLLSASTGMNFVKYILTVVMANLPAVAIYSYMGIGYKDSIYSVALMVLTMSIVTFYSVKTWYKLKKRVSIN